MKKAILLLIFAISLTACKNEKNKQTQEPETKTEPVVETQEDFIKVTFNAIVPKDDTFSLQFKKEDNKMYPKKGIKVNIQGSDLPQDLVFNLPPNNFPTGFILILGENNVENVVMNSASFDLDGENFSIEKERFFQFFNPNKHIEFNKADNSYKLKEGNKGRPFFNARKILIQRLEEKVY